MHGKLTLAVGALGISIITAGSVAALAQAPKPAAPAAAATTYRGCLQGDATKGFALVSPTGNGSDAKGQMKTYKVVPATKTVNPGPMVNKVVEVTGTLATGTDASGKIPSPDVMGDRKVVDSNRSEPASVADGMKLWADGTLTARSIRMLETSCAERSDKK